jgi:16S rRNA (cytosine967-C5)-methyltransferase
MSLPLRQFIFNTLLPFEKKLSTRIHVEDFLDQGYRTHHYSPEDRRFGTFLAYGILRNQFALASVIRQLSHIPLDKLEPKTRLLLKMGLFQLQAMDSIPDYAAVSSILDLASRLKLSQKSRGLINAILQGYIRQGKPYPTDPEIFLPPWWLEHLQQQYSVQQIHDIAQAFREIPSLSLRINTLNTSVADFLTQLEHAAILYQQSSALSEIVLITASQGEPQMLPGYREGWFMVQDESSAQVIPFLNPQPGETVLEIGSAPGSKTAYMAALMQNQGRIIAVDNSAQRMKRLEENMQRLSVSIVEPQVISGEYLVCPEPFVDKVLLDAPCSGTGTVGKHPEILFHLKVSDFKTFSGQQQTLLTHAFRYLKPSGVLVYSTCSIDRLENQEVVASFLKSHPNAMLEKDCQILPNGQRDGFYMARILKRQRDF